MPDSNTFTMPPDDTPPRSDQPPTDQLAAGALVQPVIVRPSDSDNAADVIRQKLSRIYADEPNAERELAEAEALTKRSRHQQFMHELSHSGKDLATIQTEWHNYYLSLSDQEKHRVWQEFYSNDNTARLMTVGTGSSSSSAAPADASQPMADERAAEAPSPGNAHAEAEHKHGVVSSNRQKARRASAARRPKRDLRSPAAIRSAIRDQVSAGGKLKAKHHLQSLLFGLAVGATFVIILLFGFFNEVVIAPFIQPSRAAASTPVIVDSSSVAVSDQPEIIIPKINVQIPVDYTQTSVVESDIQSGLEKGIVHYPTTVKPGEQGNAAFFGHSSNNIFNKGQYKFAFVLLHKLVEGDTFYIQYNGKMYVYKVISRRVVEPSQVDVLNNIPDKTATATLITCDPPGTSLRRLVVVGEQISPSPATNSAAVATPAKPTSTVALPGNGPTLASRLLATPLGKTIGAVIIISLIILTLRWVSRQPGRTPSTS